MLQDCLADEFVIMIDDTERSGEKNTVAEMTGVLKQNGIAYGIGKYREVFRGKGLYCYQQCEFEIYL